MKKKQVILFLKTDITFKYLHDKISENTHCVKKKKKLNS